MDTIYPGNIEQMLMQGKERLAEANEELKRIGFLYASKRGTFKEKYSVKCVKYLSEGISGNKADILATGDLSVEKGQYERLKVEFDTQGRICKNISTQINSLQSILASLNKEKDYV